MRTQFLFFFIILYFANLFSVAKSDWLILIVTFMVVISLEMLNYIGKEMLELYSVDKHLHVKRIQDIVSGTVLLASISMLVIIVIIFYPYILK